MKYVFAVMAGGLFAIGYLIGDFNVLLCSVLVLFMSNLIYGFLQWRTHIVFIFFHLTLFIFLLSRPTISMLRGNEWWYFEVDTIYFAINVLFATLLAFRVGAIIASCIIRQKEGQARIITPIVHDRAGFQYTLQIISLAFFALTMVAFFIAETEKLNFMQGKVYEEYYLSFKSQLPSYVHTVAAMMKYALCIFLATFPSKKMAFVPLALYVISAIPSLLIGMRNPIVLNALFVLLYYFLRDILEQQHRWLGKVERLGIAIMLPCAILFLSAYNYIRAGKTVSMNVWDSIVDFFYKQGVSFDVLCRGYDAIPYLPDVISKNYTFGGIIDYLTHGTIAQKLFGATELGSQNSELVAVYGNSFAHSMSYVAHPRYLQGEGWGSSYLLETFADWGYIGTIVFSLILGAVMIFMVSAFQRRGSLVRAIILVGFTKLFFVPRAEATGWLSFLLTAQFWLAVLFCYFCATLLADKKIDTLRSYSTNRKERKYIC